MILVEHCCNKEWLHNVVAFAKCEEDFVEILLDLQWWTNMVKITMLEIKHVEGHGTFLSNFKMQTKLYQDLLNSFHRI